ATIRYNGRVSTVGMPRLTLGAVVVALGAASIAGADQAIEVSCRPDTSPRTFVLTIENRGAISADAVQAMAMVIGRNGDLINGGGVVLYGGHHGGVWQHALQPGDRHEARVRAIADGGRCEPRLRLALFADGTY